LNIRREPESFAFDLRRPAGEVFEVLNNLRKVDVRVILLLACIVSSFERREFSGMLFN
jgi:hypothetical protein